MDFDLNQLVFDLLMRAPIVLFSLTIHEFMHGWVAWKCGDDTALRAGRLTLNPIAHLDPIGTLLLLLPGSPIGWAKPVPVNPYNLRRPRLDDILVSVAGVTANFLLAAGLALLARLLISMQMVPETRMGQIAWSMLGQAVLINFGLTAFNLLPIPPLDGSHVIRNLLPRSLQMRFTQIGSVFGMIMLVLLVTGIVSTRFLVIPIILVILLFAGFDATHEMLHWMNMAA